MTRFLLVVVVGLVGLSASAGIQPPCPAQHVAVGDLLVDIRGNEGAQPAGGTDQTKCMNGISSLTLFGGANVVASGRALLDSEHVLSAVSQGNDFSKTGAFGTFFTPRFGPLTTTRVDASTVRLDRSASAEPLRHVASSDTFRVVGPNKVDFFSTMTPMDASVFATPYGNWMMRFQANYSGAYSDRGIWFLGKEGPYAAETWIHATAPDLAHLVYGGSYRHEQSPDLPYDPANVAEWNIAAYDWPRPTRGFFLYPLQTGQMLQFIFDRTYSATDEIRWPMMKWFKGRFATDFTYIVRQPVSGTAYGYRGRVVLEPSFDFTVAASNDAAYQAEIAGTSWPIK